MNNMEEFWEKRNTSNVMMHYTYSDDEFLQKDKSNSADSGAGYPFRKKNYDKSGRKQTSGVSVDDPDYMYY